MTKFVLYLAFAALAFIPSVSSAALAPGAINIVNFGFQDATTGLSVTVASGSITWTDVSGVHTVTSSSGAFNSGPLGPGDTFSPELASGVYIYACAFHPSMRGVLVVE